MAPEENGEGQRTQQAEEQIHDRIWQSAHHMRTEEEIQKVFIKFPKKRGGRRAGKCKKDLDWKGNFADQFLRIPDRRAIEIGNGHSSKKMKWNIQWRK